MTSGRFKSIAAALALPVMVFSLTVSTAAQQTDSVSDRFDPSAMHQILAESKAQALFDKQLIRKMAAQIRLENTQTNYDVLFYDIAIRVNDTNENLYGKVGFTAEAAENGVTEVQVDFHSTMQVDSIVAPIGALSYSRAGDVVTIVLDGAYDSGEQFTFDFYSHGHPTEGGFQAFAFDTRLGAPVIASLSEPYFARTWWPCKDRMDDKADSFNIAITVDTALYVASNGTLDSVVQSFNNAHTYYYAVRYPMVTYLFSVAISNYTVWYDEWVYNDGLDTMPLVHAVYPDLYDYSLTHFDITPYALTVYSDNYGLYPFVNEKYGHANFEWGGAMEHQTMTSTAGSGFGFSEPVVVHELSHQWWGDMITCKSWAHIWLNEGWASYSEALYYLEKDGWQAYHDYMNGMAYAGGGTIYVYDTTSVWNIFHGGLSYDKGAWVVHMLRGVLGDPLFFAGINAYYNSEYQHAAATTEDFRDVLEAATGQELDWFFEDWIYGEYRPNYHFRYWAEPSDTGGYDLFLHIEQVQTTVPRAFRMPVDFFFDFNTIPDDTVTLRPTERQQLMKFNLPDNVVQIECDPAGWVLKYSSHVPWQLHFVTTDKELSSGLEYADYCDTLDVRGTSFSYTYSLAGGILPNGCNLSGDGIISGMPTKEGQYVFTARVDDDFNSFYDEYEFTLVVASAGLIPGDVDHDFEEVNISDLVYLVDYMFINGPEPPIMDQADMDASCQIDIADLVYLVDYMFDEGPAPLIGCVL